MTTNKSSKSSFSKSALEQFQFEVASELGLADKLKSNSSSLNSSSSESPSSK